MFTQFKDPVKCKLECDLVPHICVFWQKQTSRRKLVADIDRLSQ